MANDKLRPPRGRLAKVSGIFVNPRDQYVIKTTAKNEKTGRLDFRKRTLPAGATEEDALRALAEVKEEIRNGGAQRPKPLPVMPTLRAYVPCWSARQLSKGKWSAEAGTADTVGWRFDRYVIPVLGDHLIGTIDFADLERWLDWMASEVQGAGTIRAVYFNLRSVIRAGRQELGLPGLPTWPEPPRMVNEPEVDLDWDNYDAEPGRALTKEQLGLFLKAAQSISPTGWYPLSLLGFGSDARFSELATVLVEDLRLSDEVGVWLCRRHLVKGREAPGVKHNRRGVTRLLDPETTRLLRPFLDGKEPKDLLFPSDQPGYRFRSQKGMQDFLDRASRATGLPRMTSKVFRRTYITLSHHKMMADALTQAQAGHSDPKTTGIYIRPSIEQRKAHAQKLADVLYETEDPATE